jgi:uncharacterized protein YneF (UPF0154 family)
MSTIIYVFINVVAGAVGGVIGAFLALKTYERFFK